TKQTAQTYTENKSGVMLQGFNWDSAPRGEGYNAENPNPAWGQWYGVMLRYANEIKDRFEYVWFPPPSKTDTGSSEGYAPNQLNDLNNCYGTEEELKEVIQAIQPAKAIADIVVNHRSGTTSWGDFTNPKWTDDYYSICKNDEGFSLSGSPMLGSSKKGAADSGQGYAAYRDLDHTNAAVQQGIYSWMNSVLKRAGFVGWRYDYVKGFAGDYVGYYNAMSDAAFSVGEYWPDSDGWSTQINSWISATGKTVSGQAGKKSRAFDFVLKQKMNEAFGWYKMADGTEENNRDLWNMSLLADAATLMMSNPSAAVTFVDNHDTGSTQQHWELDWGDVAAAYAFILTHPGMPCVANQHYFAEEHWQYRGEEVVSGTKNTMKQHIDYLIKLRHTLGIEYDDTVTVLASTETNYVAKIVGTKGEIIVKIGGDAYSPTGTGYTGNYPIYSGTNFAIWQKGEAGVEPTSVNITITASDDWIWEDKAELFAWVWGGSYGGGKWVKASGSSMTINLTIIDDATGFNFARCVAGTTEPDWGATGNNSGRIYNKSPDVTYTAGKTSYAVGYFTEYNPSAY
ncbi:MAG: alpha-amylase family glycosyl hydrolase, partial [Spirochaetota bacterium]|nr:alpha-amylase family glycosyl hydrolase [Spirochaetota bacterium]